MIYVAENGKEFNNKDECSEYEKKLIFDDIKKIIIYNAKSNFLSLIDKLDYEAFCRTNTITEEKFVKSVKELEKLLKAGE